VGWATTSVAHGATKSPSKEYQATTVLLSTGSGSSQGFTTNLQTLATLATIPDMVKRVASDVHYPGDPLSLSSHVAVTGDSQTGLLNITATSADARQAALWADTFAIDLLTFLREQATTQNAQQATAISKQLKTL